MAYRSLALFHVDRTNERFSKYVELADERHSVDSAFRTGIITNVGELFMAVSREALSPKGSGDL